MRACGERCRRAEAVSPWYYRSDYWKRLSVDSMTNPDMNGIYWQHTQQHVPVSYLLVLHGTGRAAHQPVDTELHSSSLGASGHHVDFTVVC